jgi:hypothetical protein
LLYDNTQAVNILTDVVDEAQVPAHIAMVMQDHLQVCQGIPDRQGSNCTAVLHFKDNKVVEVEEVTNDSLIGGSGAQGGFALDRRRFRRRRRTVSFLSNPTAPSNNPSQTQVRRQVVEEEEESASSDEGEVSSDDEGGVSSSDEEGAESDDEGEDDDGTTSTATVATATVIAATTTASSTSQAAASSTSSPARIPLPVEGINASGQSTGPGVVSLPLSCIYSLSWLEEKYAFFFSPFPGRVGIPS